MLLMLDIKTAPPSAPVSAPVSAAPRVWQKPAARLALLGCAAAVLGACAVTPAPTAAAPVPAVLSAPAPQPVAAPAPAPPPPVYTAPDYTTLPGHSSVTTPVPVDPIDVEGLGPVIGP